MLARVLTSISDLIDRGAEFSGHETQETEYDEAGKNTGEAVTQGDDHCVPTGRENT